MTGYPEIPPENFNSEAAKAALNNNSTIPDTKNK